MKTSYTYINKWRAELTFYLVTASFCNYKPSVKVKAFLTFRADVKILCCCTDQLKSVQTVLYTCHYLYFIRNLHIQGHFYAELQTFKPDSFSKYITYETPIYSEAFHCILLKAKLFSFFHCFQQHKVCICYRSPRAPCPDCAVHALTWLRGIWAHTCSQVVCQDELDKTLVLSNVVVSQGKLYQR